MLRRCCAKLFRFLLLVASANLIGGQLPDQLDPFLEKLFEYEECEDFLGSTDYTNIATTKCDPHTCDFPRQICARPAAKFQDSSANTCRNVPLECITAANGGVAPGPSIHATPSPFLPPPSLPNVISPMIPAPPPTASITPSPTDPMAICQMGVPNGRFCGFRPMYTYNKETLQCDEFWFPGCRTADTNANLFEDYQQCQKVADMCKPTPAPTPPPFRPRPTTRRPPPPKPRPPPPPPAPAPSPFVDAFKGFGGNSPAGQGALGALGMFTGSGLGPTGQGPLGNFSPNPNAGAAPNPGPGGAGGAGGQDGQDLGLFGLIQQGIMGAQAAGQGGKGGKEAASKAAGQILQQFTGFDLGGIGNNFGGLFG